jgi:hypothetical protein
MKQEWTEEQVRSYIESLNYFIRWYSEDDRRVIQNEWKNMLWLEKHGCDFSTITFHGSIDYCIDNPDEDEDDGSYIYFSEVSDREELSEVSDWEERRMIYHVRNHMREILGMSQLDETAFEKMLSDVIKPECRLKLLGADESDERVRIMYSYDPNRYTIADIEKDAEEIEKWIYSVAPNSIESFIELARFSKDDITEEFYDEYTSNKRYKYRAKESFKPISAKLIYFFAIFQINMRYPEIHYGTRDGLYNHFIGILYKKYTGCNISI